MYNNVNLFHREFPSKLAPIQLVKIIAATPPPVKMEARVVTCVMSTKDDLSAHVLESLRDTSVKSHYLPDHAKKSGFLTRHL